MKRISTLLCVFLAIGNLLQAQTVQFHNFLDSTYDPDGKYSFVGKVGGNNLLVYSDLRNGTKLAIFDNNGALIRERTYDFINRNSTNLIIAPRGADHWSMVVQEVADKMYYAQTVTFDGNGEIIDGPKKIDSALYVNLGWNAYYQLANERHSNYFLLYRVVRNSAWDRIVMNYLLLDKNAKPIGSKTFSIPWDDKFETPSKVFLGPDGAVYFAVHDKDDNYRLGSKLRLYKSTIASDKPVETEIYVKENKPIELMFDVDDENRFIAMGGFYTNFYSKSLDGLLTIFFDIKTNKVDTVVYVKMDKEFKKEVKKGISSITADNLVNTTKLRYFQVNKDRTISIVADLVAKRQNASGAARSNSYIIQNNYSGVSTSFTTPSQSFDQMRSSLAITQLPPIDNGTGLGMSFSAGSNPATLFQAYDMPGWNRHIANLQTSELTNPYLREISSAYYREKYAYPISANRMVRKSIVFTLNNNYKEKWKTSVSSPYLSETPFTRLIAMPSGNGVRLINYEIFSKKDIFLEQKTFTSNGKLIKQVVSAPGMPLLFYKEQLLRLNDKETLVLYFDPLRYKVGLATIYW